MNEESISFAADSLSAAQPETYEVPARSLFDLFMSGGPAIMATITLFLIAILMAAWKAPRWVKEIGIGALAFSVFGTLAGCYQAFGVLQMVAGVSPCVIYGGLRCGLVPVLYGLIVYFISLVIRVIQKPRI